MQALGWQAQTPASQNLLQTAEPRKQEPIARGQAPKALTNTKSQTNGWKPQ